MDLHYIDYVSVTGRGWLHRLPAWGKLISVLLLLGVLLGLHSVPATGAVLAVLVIIAFSARLPVRLYLALLLYPVFFLTVLLVSVGDLTLAALLMLVTRVLAITAAVIMLLLSTSFPAIFGALSRVLPDFLVAALFFTYRAIFVMADSLANVRIAVHLRGGMNWRHPLATLRQLGLAFGHVLVHAIDTSQHMADSLTVRGFRYRLYPLGRRYE